METLFKKLILGQDVGLAKNAKLHSNDSIVAKTSDEILRFFSGWRDALENLSVEQLKQYGDTKSDFSVTWKISAKQCGIFQGYLPSQRMLCFSGSAFVEINAGLVSQIQLYFDEKSLEEQIVPKPNYAIAEEKLFNNLEGKGSKLYQLLLSSRNGQFYDSKYALIHALRKDAMRAPDISLLNHEEIQVVKNGTKLEKVKVQLANHQEIELFVYSPINKALERDLPTVLYLHGGGWCMGSPESYDLVNRKLALSSGIRVICPKYRLSPEHPYPAGFEDCYHTYLYLRDHSSLGAVQHNSKNIFVAGDSSGGGFCAALALKMRDLGEKMPDGLLLLSPATDMRLENYHSYNFFSKNNLMIDHGLIGLIRGAYVEGDLWDHPYVSPMRGDFSEFPPALIMIGEEDPLFDENWCLAKKISRESGRAPKVIVGKQMPHHYHTFLGLSDEVDRLYEEINVFINPKG